MPLANGGDDVHMKRDLNDVRHATRSPLQNAMASRKYSFNVRRTSEAPQNTRSIHPTHSVYWFGSDRRHLSRANTYLIPSSTCGYAPIKCPIRKESLHNTLRVLFRMHGPIGRFVNNASADHERRSRSRGFCGSSPRRKNSGDGRVKRPPWYRSTHDC